MEKSKSKNAPEEKVLQILENSERGSTITELTTISKLSRSAVRTSLAKLEGAEKISFHPIGMAKVYFSNQ